MDKSFLLRLSEEDFKKIEKEAKKDGRSINNYINQLIKKHLESKKEK